MKATLLCLHGWGGSKESFSELRGALRDDGIEILTPDLPGFGDEPEPRTPWTTDDYVEWVKRYIENEKPKTQSQTLFLLGHSHGGRIACKLAARGFPIDHLFLCASAGIHRPRHMKRVLGLTLAKTGKFFLSVPGLRALQPASQKLLYKLVRVHDYERASPIMRQTLINVTREDLRPILQHIRVPTDIFWGEDDRMTPVADAHVFRRGIAGSTLTIFPGIRHAVHRDAAIVIAAAIRMHLARQ